MDDIKDLIIKLRKEIDEYSELAWNETKTSSLILKTLGRSNLVFQEKTALVYKLDFGKTKNIILRSELDALQTVEGARHVCGHSAHTSALIGLYKYIESIDLNLPFNLYFVFQPSEEDFPSGAKYVSEEYFSKKRIDIELSIAFHTFPSTKPLEISDTTFASGDYFEIDVNTEATHIKNKNSMNLVDSIGIASEIASKINTTFNENFIINVGVMKGGETPNSLSAKAILKGDIRALLEPNRINAHNFLNELIETSKSKYKYAEINLMLSKYYPVLNNDDLLIRKLRKSDFVLKEKKHSFATEDFSFLPGRHLFLLVGNGNNIELHDKDYFVPYEVNTALIDKWVELLNIISIDGL